MAARLLPIRLNREETSIPWGFRLEGGVDLGHPINIQNVTPGTIADRCGLQAGDYVIRINRSDTNWMRHEDAKMEIIRSGNDIELLVERGSVHLIRSAAPVTMMPVNSWNKSNISPKAAAVQQKVWQPKIVSPSSPVRHNYMDTYTSLEADVHKQENIGVKHNVSPTPFGQEPPAPGQSVITRSNDGRVHKITHSNYNSPMGLYARRNLDEAFESKCSAINSASRPNTRGGLSAKGTKTADTSTKYCGSCGDFIRGVFVKVHGGVPMHPECLKCCKCGVGLRNIGYFYICEKLYCEKHARQAAPPPEPGMTPVVVYK